MTADTINLEEHTYWLSPDGRVRVEPPRPSGRATVSPGARGVHVNNEESVSSV